MNEKEQQAFDLAGTKEKRILGLYKTLIGVDTTVPPGKNCDTLLDLIEPEFQRLGFTTERVTVPDDKVATIPLPLEGPRGNLVATRSHGKEQSRRLMYVSMLSSAQRLTAYDRARIKIG